MDIGSNRHRRGGKGGKQRLIQFISLAKSKFNLHISKKCSNFAADFDIKSLGKGVG